LINFGVEVEGEGDEEDKEDEGLFND